MLTLMMQAGGVADTAGEIAAGDTYKTGPEAGQPYITGNAQLDFWRSYFANLTIPDASYSAGYRYDPRFVSYATWVTLTDAQQQAAIAGITPVDVSAAEAAFYKVNTPAPGVSPLTVGEGPPPIQPPPNQIQPPPNTPSLTPIGEGPPPGPALVGPTGVRTPIITSLDTGTGDTLPVSPVLSAIAAATQPAAASGGPASAPAPVPTPGSANEAPAPASAAIGMSTTTKILLGLLALLVVAKFLKD